MSILQLPLTVDGTSDYVYKTTLDDVTCSYRFKWNTRAGGWFLYIYSEDGEFILSHKVVLTTDLLYRSHYDKRLPPGVLWFADSGPLADQEISIFEDLGNRVQFYYEEYTAPVVVAVPVLDAVEPPQEPVS
jgi:hypothetical protein